MGCSGNVDATAGSSASSPKAGAVGISRCGSIFNGKQNRIMITTKIWDYKPRMQATESKRSHKRK